MINGVINVYKEKGFTSFDVVAKLRGILKIKKIGHTGTLDPDATGVLPICIGKATKLCDMLTDTDKAYLCSLKLGVETDTLDMTGTVLKEASEEDMKKLSVEEIEGAILSFVGDIMQVPPMYSALKVNGKKLYELARKGEEVERKARPVTIYSIENINIDMENYTASFLVNCSKGTYIRTLCDDIGRKLLVGGAMAFLERKKAASFTIDTAKTLSEIEAIVKSGDEEAFSNILVPIDKMFLVYPALIADIRAQKALLNGNMLEEDMLFELDDKEEISSNSEKTSGENIKEVTGEGIKSNKDKKYRIYDHNRKFVGIYSKKDDKYVIEKMFYEVN